MSSTLCDCSPADGLDLKVSDVVTVSPVASELDDSITEVVLTFALAPLEVAEGEFPRDKA